jgi:galactokinase
MSEVVTRTHGRVNLIGEHTDYNGGWVLPTTIPQYTEVRVKTVPGRNVVLESSFGRSASYSLGEEEPQGDWADYLMGATKFLSEFISSGLEVKISSTIPEGSGLSSSAALEMSFLLSLKKLFSLPHDERALARLGQRIENEFVGAKVGIMDQMAVSMANEGEALFLDTRTLRFERVPLPLEEMDLLVINSGISHRLSESDGGYNQRRAECEKASALLGIRELRDISAEELARKDLPQNLMRRARHVVTENERVHRAVEAIRKKDLEKLGILFYESHLSMKEDYEVSLPEIDYLVDLCRRERDVFGARLTGGGFGGSVVVLTKKDAKARVARAVIPAYLDHTGETGTLLV